MSWHIFAVCPEHLVRFRVFNSGSISISLPDYHSLPQKIIFLNIIICWTIPKLPLLPMRQETSRLHWDPGRGRGLGETKSLRQAAENPQFNQHQNVLFSLRGAPSQKAEIVAICQAKRSAQTLWNYKNNIANSSQSPTPETPTWQHQPSPCAALEPHCFSTSHTVFQPTTHSAMIIFPP